MSKYVYLTVIGVEGPIANKDGNVYWRVKVRHTEERENGPKIRRRDSRSSVDTDTLVMWHPDVVFKTRDGRDVLPTSTFPVDQPYEVGEPIEGCLREIECAPGHPYKWVNDQGATVYQNKVKVAVDASPDNDLFSRYLVQAIAAKGIVPADESLRKGVSIVPAAARVDAQDTPENETPEVILQDPFGAQDSGATT